jgi:hypothetical protein
MNLLNNNSHSGPVCKQKQVSYLRLIESHLNACSLKLIILPFPVGIFSVDL